MTAGFAKPRYGNSQFSKNFRLQTDKNGGTTHNVFRILPPMKSLGESGKWAIYNGVHFGYCGINREDPDRPKNRPFLCIQQKDFRSGVVKAECPECSKIDSMKKDLELREAEAKTKGLSEDETTAVTGGLKLWLRSHNVDRKHFMAVLSASGEFGVLAISHKLKKKLDAKIEQLVNQHGIDPLDLEQGVFFDFVRTGRGLQTEDTVDAQMETIKENGRMLSSVKVAPLSQEQSRQALEVVPDLTEIHRVLSYEQIEALVNGSGDPEEVDSIFDMSIRRESSPSPKARTTSKALDVAQALPTEREVQPLPVSVPAAVSSASQLSDEDFLKKYALRR